MFFFDSWLALGRVAIVGLMAYLALVVLLRISGKRTLSKLNAFDFVVTIALGSTLATVLLSKDVSLSEGILAFALLIFLQFAITWLSVRSEKAQQLVKAEPSLLFFRGRFLEKTMRHERVTEEEIRATARRQGIADLEKIGAIVLETDGSLNVLTNIDRESEGSSLANVSGFSQDGSSAK